MVPQVLLLSVLLSGAPPAPSPTPEMLHQAEIQAAKALASWEAKAFSRAAQYFLEAYALSGEPTQLRNAAKALESAGSRDEATSAWRQLLERTDLTDAQRAEAEARIAALAEEEETRPIDPAPPPIVAPPLDPVAVTVAVPPAAPAWPPWLLAASGVAAAAAGGVLYWRSADELGALQDLLAITDDQGLIVGVQHDEAVRMRRRINGLRASGVVALSLGITCALAGVSWWWLEW